MIRYKEFQRLFIFKICIYYAFIVAGLIINFLQLLTFIFIWPFDKLLYRKIIYYLAYSLYSIITALPQWWCESKLKVYTSPEDSKLLGKENCFCVFNHRYDIDWVLGWVFAQSTGHLGGAKVILKSPLKYVPILGWSWMFSEYIFVRREWEVDRREMAKDLQTIFDFPKGYLYSVTIFCEGTRFTPEKHAESMKVAREKGLPDLKYHLLPRSKGFYLSASHIDGKIEYIYDCNLAMKDVNGHSPRFTDLVNGEKIDAELYIRRIPLANASPRDEKLCTQFLHKLYKEKDDIFDIYQRTGSYENVPGVIEHVYEQNRYDMYNALGWLILVMVPSIYFLIQGSWLFKCLIAVMVIFLNFFVKWMMSKSDVRKASKFGLTNGGSNNKKQN